MKHLAHHGLRRQVGDLVRVKREGDTFVWISCQCVSVKKDTTLISSVGFEENHMFAWIITMGETAKSQRTSSPVTKLSESANLVGGSTSSWK